MFKLSEKGKRKFLDNFYWFSEEFEQDDFEDCVMLTIEEAKEIATLCGEAEFYAMQDESIKAKRHVGKARDLLVKRIEQAEVARIGEDYNKALNNALAEFQKQEERIRLKCEIEQLKAEQELDNWLKQQFLKRIEDKDD